MAIAANAPRISDYRRDYGRKLIIAGVVAQLIPSLAAVGAIVIPDQSKLTDLSTWLIAGVVFLTASIVYIVLVLTLRKPLFDLLSALANKSGETTDIKPPNPNLDRYKNTGIKTALQLIYDSGTEVDAQDPDEENPADNSPLTIGLNHTSCGIVVFDSNKQIVSANQSAPIAKDVKGNSYLALDFLGEQNIFDWLKEIEESSINAERRWSRISTDPEVINKQRIYDVIASYEKGAAGETVVVLIDRSEWYIPEEEDLNFIAFAAHELRGPITVIRGYLDVLEQELSGRLSGDEPELIKRLVVSSNRLSSYVGNILNVAKFDRHHLKVHLVEDSVWEIYNSIADDMQLRASSQQRMLNIDLPKDLPTVAADRGSIQEVIGNLVDNAIKYSFEGGVINVKAEVKGEFVEISVADNGVGMPASVVKNLFHKFYRSHRSKEAVAGTGIGLYLCKAFVESHGGSISARSKENEGSVFSFTLPIYETVKDKLLEDGQLNSSLIRQGSGWIKNHAMYRD